MWASRPTRWRIAASWCNVASRSLGVGAGELQRKLRTGKYMYFYGPYTATEIEPLRRLSGVHLEGSFRRDYPSSLAAPVIGRLPPDSSRGGSGLERSLDNLLTGTPGEAVFLRDRVGRRLESPARKISDPVPGNDVWLTLDAELQDIAERELEDAIRQLGARGGDVVVLDPRTGELLAVASRQAGVDPAASSPTAFTSPFEPGSTAKLFTAAALLQLDKVDSTVRVSGEDGHYLMPLSRGQLRSITDEHKIAGLMTLADAIRMSSNIGMAKFSQRLSTTEQFEVLRDFGFGSPTGIEFPSESRGMLNTPEHMIPDYSRASMAMGYELGVTALQLAMAYAAIANDGVLMTPTLVREVRDPAGQLLYQHQPEPVRRVISSRVAARLQAYLRSVVEEGGGTGDKARLANYELAGKTGTARRFEGRSYANKGYRASFAALLPGEGPAARARGHHRRPQEGVIFRRVDGGTAHQAHARAGTGVALYRHRPGPARRDNRGRSGAVACPSASRGCGGLGDAGFVALPESRHDRGEAGIDDPGRVRTRRARSGARGTPAWLQREREGDGTGRAQRSRRGNHRDRRHDGYHLDRGMTAHTGRLVDALRRADLLVEADTLPPLSGISSDSRSVTPGSLYVAVRGSQADGHRFIADSVGRGAVAVVVESRQPVAVPQVVVRDGRLAALALARAWYGDPRRTMQLIGDHRHQRQDDDDRTGPPPVQCAGHGRQHRHTRRLRWPGRSVPSTAGTLTTPGPVDLQATFATLRDRGCTTVAMETSSHSLDQGRLDGLDIRGGHLHQPHARPSRLSRHDGGVPRRQAAADHPARPVRFRHGEHRRPRMDGTAARRPAA